MGQEFTINSTAIEEKINQLLPSQGGFGAGVDLSGSTMVIPVVDVTNAAEGSILPTQLQQAFGLGSISTSEATNSTQTLSLSTGFWRVLSIITSEYTSSIGGQGTVGLTDGSTTQNYLRVLGNMSLTANTVQTVNDQVIFAKAGTSLIISSNTTLTNVYVAYRQVADSQGNLLNPSGFSIT